MKTFFAVLFIFIVLGGCVVVEKHYVPTTTVAPAPLVTPQGPAVAPPVGSVVVQQPVYVPPPVYPPMFYWPYYGPPVGFMFRFHYHRR